jgi:hypothetical protein
MRAARALVGLFVFVLVAGNTTIAAAGVVTESGDAGQTLSDYQDTTSSGVIDTISGTFNAGTDADLYLIYIHDPASFSALASGAVGMDPQLFLLTADGKAIYGNDDDTGVGGIVFGTALLPVDLISALPAGNYLLGIAMFDVDPIDDSNVEIFSDQHSGIASPTTTTTLAGFNTDHQGSPVTTPVPYTIILTGAGIAVPEPSTFIILAGSLALLSCGKRPRRSARKPCHC